VSSHAALDGYRAFGPAASRRLCAHDASRASFGRRERPGPVRHRSRGADAWAGWPGSSPRPASTDSFQTRSTAPPLPQRRRASLSSLEAGAFRRLARRTARAGWAGAAFAFNVPVSGAPRRRRKHRPPASRTGEQLSAWHAPRGGCALCAMDSRGQGRRPALRLRRTRGNVRGAFVRVAIGRIDRAARRRAPLEKATHRRVAPFSRRSPGGGASASSTWSPLPASGRSKCLAAPRASGMRDASDRLVPSHVSYEYPRLVGSRCVTREAPASSGTSPASRRAKSLWRARTRCTQRTRGPVRRVRAEPLASLSLPVRCGRSRGRVGGRAAEIVASAGA